MRSPASGSIATCCSGPARRFATGISSRPDHRSSKAGKTIRPEAPVRPLGLRRQGLHTFNELGVTENASRLEKVLYLGRQPVDSRIRRGELIERFPELEPILKIRRALPLGAGKSEVRDRG